MVTGRTKGHRVDKSTSKSMYASSNTDETDPPHQPERPVNGSDIGCRRGYPPPLATQGTCCNMLQRTIRNEKYQSDKMKGSWGGNYTIQTVRYYTNNSGLIDPFVELLPPPNCPCSFPKTAPSLWNRKRRRLCQILGISWPFFGDNETERTVQR